MEVTREVVLPAETSEVWRAVTDPAELGGWLGGEVDIEVRPGGRGTFVEPGSARRLAVVDDVDDGRSWRFHWWPEDGSGPITEVTVAVEPIDGSADGEDATKVTVTETVVAGAGMSWDLRLLGLELRSRTLARV